MFERTTEVFRIFESADELTEAAHIHAQTASPEYKTSVYYYYIARYLVVVQEATFEEIPIQVWNQYRNALDHFFRRTTSASPDEARKQLKSIEGHLLRAVLDIAKLLCYKATDTFDQIINSQNVRILYLLDEGKFYQVLLEKKDEAYKRFITAKMMDINLGTSIEQDKEVVKGFLDPCFTYISLIKAFNNRRVDIERIKIKEGYYNILEYNPSLAGVAGSVIVTNNKAILEHDGKAVDEANYLEGVEDRPVISSDEAIARIAANIRMNLKRHWFRLIPMG